MEYKNQKNVISYGTWKLGNDNEFNPIVHPFHDWIYAATWF